jgi:hypothetical protein
MGMFGVRFAVFVGRGRAIKEQGGGGAAPVYEPGQMKWIDGDVSDGKHVSGCSLWVALSFLLRINQTQRRQR